MYIVNKGMDPAPSFQIDADRYEEQGSYTKFFKEDVEVQSLLTSTVFSIATE